MKNIYFNFIPYHRIPEVCTKFHVLKTTKRHLASQFENSCYGAASAGARLAISMPMNEMNVLF